MDQLTETEFDQLFETFKRAAFRLEARESYAAATSYAGDPFSKFLAGEPDDYQWRAEWDALVATRVREGGRFERVRVVSEPLSDYSRFELAQTPLNAQAGEDIRYLERAKATALGLPAEDYWLFDACVAVVYCYGPDGSSKGRRLLTDAAAVAMRSTWRDTAWHHAVGWEEFAAKHGG